MRIFACCITALFLFIGSPAAQCVSQNRVVIKGLTCPGCVYDLGDSVFTYDDGYLWIDIMLWTDSINFEEAIPHDTWNRQKRLLLSNNIWGTNVCATLQLFSLLRQDSRNIFHLEGHGVYWYTPLYIEVVAEPYFGQGSDTYVADRVYLLQRYCDQPLGITLFQ